jgi:cytochrome c oxidase cbb3-type subunit 4
MQAAEEGRAMQDTHSILAEIADNWMLIAMAAFFVGAVLFAFRPGSRKLHEDIANIPLRNEDRPPAPDEEGR